MRLEYTIMNICLDSQVSTVLPQRDVYVAVSTNTQTRYIFNNPERHRTHYPLPITHHEHIVYYDFSTPGSVDSGVIAPNSEPVPLCPRFLPGRWKLRCGKLPLDSGSVVVVKSPKRENRPLFFGCCGLISSSSPTSSNGSSSMDSDLSNPLAYSADGDVTREKRESRDVRDCMVSL